MAPSRRRSTADGFTGLQQYGGQFGIGIDSRTVKGALNAFGRANKASNPQVGMALQPITLSENSARKGALGIVSTTACARPSC